jgi:proteasome accessory factor C
MKRIHERVRRLLALIPHLRSHQGESIEDLARFAGVSRRQVLKDLDCILMCGVPPYLPDDYVTYWIENGKVFVDFADHFRRPSRLTLEEALSLKIFLHELPAALRGAYAGRLEAIESKLNRASASPVSLGEIVEEEHLSAIDMDLRRSIERAIDEKKLLRLSYFSYSRGELADRVVAPYALAVRKGMYYVVGLCKGRKKVRSFRLDRIREVKLLGETFEPPKDFDVDREAALNISDHEGAPFTVRVRFSSSVARWVMESYPNIVESRSQDGDVVVKFETENLRWAALWVLPYAENAEILEPPEARCEMRKLLQAMLEVQTGI